MKTLIAKPRPRPVTPAASAPTRRRWLPWLIVLVGACAYSNSFTGTFLFDDRQNILENLAIRAPLAHLGSILIGVRPIVTMTLALNYAISGLDVWSYHLINLLIHLAAGLTLYGLVRRTLRLPQFQADYATSADALALAAAMLWVCHPLQTESVTYLIQRGESLMGLCYLLVLYCIMRGATTQHPGRWYIAAVLASAVGMGSKEVMATAPVLALIYDRIFLARSWKQLYDQRRWLYAGLAGTWAVLAVPVGIALGPDRSNGIVGGAGFHLEGMTPWQYARSQPGVIAYYLRLSLWPSPLCFDYGWPIAQDWSAILPPALLIAALLALTLWALFHRPALGFLGLAFFLVLAVTSSFVPIKDLAFEHRMYLSLAAEIVLLVITVDYLLRKLQQRGAIRPQMSALIATSLTVAPVAIFAMLSFARNEDYQSELAMWSDVVVKRPANARAHNNLGTALQNEGRWSEALEEFRLAVQLDPKNAEAHNNLGVALREAGDLDDARRSYLKALSLNPHLANAYNNLAMLLVKQGKPDAGLHVLDQGLELAPQSPLLVNNRGEILERLGRRGEAIVCYRQAVDLAPGSLKYRCNLATALEDQGQHDAARSQFEVAFQLAPDWPDEAAGAAWSLATSPEARRRDGLLAVRYARQACQATDYQRPELLDALAAAYAEAGRFPDAVATITQAIQRAATGHQESLADSLKHRLHVYQAHQPYRDTSMK